MSAMVIFNKSDERRRVADAFIAEARNKGAWPTKVDLEGITTSSGLVVRNKAVVAEYEDGTRDAYGVVGKRYTPTGVESWEETVRAAVFAGAEPKSFEIMMGGASVFAGFEVDDGNGFKSNFHLLDDLSGNRAMQHFATLFRVFCKNQQAQFSPHATSIRHTASIDERMESLRDSIEDAIIVTRKAKDVYKYALSLTVSGPEVEDLLHFLFPDPPKATQRILNNMDNKRREILASAANPVNNEGRNLATLWNALTHNVDYEPDGSPRPIRKSINNRTLTEMHLLGPRGKEVRDIYSTIQDIIEQGSIRDYLAVA